MCSEVPNGSMHKGRSTGMQHYLSEFLHGFVVFCCSQGVVWGANSVSHIPDRQYLIYYIDIPKHWLTNPTSS